MRAVLLALLISIAAIAQGPIVPNEPITLFNGEDLTHWYTFLRDHGKNVDPNEVFTVSDGEIRISGEDWGCITTDKEYANYRLLVEWRWGGKTWEPRIDRARDSGILIHSVGKDGGYSNVWMTGIECQIIEGGTGDILVVGDKSENFAATAHVAGEMQGSSHVWQEGGDAATIHSGRLNWWGRDPEWKDVIGFRGKQDVEMPCGEWNTMECVADGAKLTIFLNGERVNEAVEVKPAAGKIQIQSEGAEIFIRRIELQPLK